MPRYKLTIAYDGTDFCGWQKQEPLLPPSAEGGLPPSLAPSEEGGRVLEAGGGEERTSEKTAAFSSETPLIPSTREGRVALRTVQGVVEQAVRAVVREPVELIGASRTDSGVHARGQVAAFTCEPRELSLTTPTPTAATATTDDDGAQHPQRGAGWPIERGTDRLVMAINSRLPADVQVIAAEQCDPTFNPIGDATSKAYSYTLHVGRQRPLWERRYVRHIPHGTLDAAAMHAAAQALIGEHDFAAFAAAGHGRLSTVRTVFDCRVILLPLHNVEGVAESARPGEAILRAGNSPTTLVRIDITGSGFLWNMVRIVVGTLVQVGLGQRTPADVQRILASRDRAQAGPTMGPEGLCLEWIRYSS